MGDTGFELVKGTLTDLFVQIQSAHGAGAVGVIQKELISLSAQYSNLTATNRKPLDYSDPVTRFAYVYAYVAAHSNWIQSFVSNVEEIRHLIRSTDPVRVTCLGGGPGTELVGLIRACNGFGRKAPLTCFLVDSEDGWAETWTEVDHKIGASFKVSTAFRRVDITNPPALANLTKAFEADLFIANFFLSEIFSFRDKAAPFLSGLATSAKPGALVLYIDNCSDQFTNYAESLFDKAHFDLIYKIDKEHLQISSNEEKKDLGEFLTMIGRQPKLGSDASVRVWRKK